MEKKQHHFQPGDRVSILIHLCFVCGIIILSTSEHIFFFNRLNFKLMAENQQGQGRGFGQDENRSNQGSDSGRSGSSWGQDQESSNQGRGTTPMGDDSSRAG